MSKVSKFIIFITIPMNYEHVVEIPRQYSVTSSLSSLGNIGLFLL